MKLLQVKIRGSASFSAGNWLELGPQLNLFQYSRQNRLNGCEGHEPETDFLKILETINPIYKLAKVKPFADFPEFIKKNGHTRRINPAKRTIAFAVFSASPQLVKELATLNDWLYETDRIEIGRRLDYSRWINFVELASSTRWSEISEDIQSLQDQLQQQRPKGHAPLTNIFRTAKPSDRVKGELQHQLLNWLEELPAALYKTSGKLIERVTTAVLRVDHFQRARKIVRNRLPVFIRPGYSKINMKSGTPNLSNLLELISEIIGRHEQKSDIIDTGFLEQLNEQLEKQLVALNLGDMALQITKSGAGLSLEINKKPYIGPVGLPLSPLRQLQLETCLSVAFSRIACNSEPILLFDEPGRIIKKSDHEKLAQFITNISRTCQCIYSYSDLNIFPDDVKTMRYRAEDLISINA